MNFIKNIFKKKEAQITSYADFWSWFEQNEKTFFNVMKEKGHVERDFFDKLSPKLAEIKSGFFYLAGVFNEDTVELVFTADGEIKNIIFIEELVNAAPEIKGWMFKALKPAIDIKNVSIKMADEIFSSDNLNFYPNEHADLPDQIDITLVHDNLNENNKSTIINGTYIFLDNILGELNSATTIDNISFISKNEAAQELIPIEKLKAYLIWREKEFIEKYEGIRHDTENDAYSMLEAELDNGNPLLAVINKDLLDWDSKASHPWILNIEVKYDGSKNSGMPNESTYKLLEQIEDELLQQLKDVDGYLNIGRQTSDNTREIYFACKDFRKPSTVVYDKKREYSGKVDIDYNIYKDKYWQSFSHFK